ncbi:hypothetical protein FACS189468_0290 [Spirochaetia bacterium]|nr:hypothetical protein FACS189468_0290 [Spirochaetia bacterium]
MVPRPIGTSAAVLIPVLVFFVSAGLGGQTNFPDLNADPRAKEYAARNGTWQDLAEIALWASGWNPTGSTTGSFAGNAANRRTPPLEMILQAAEELRTSAALPPTPRERGEFILSFIHKRFLKSYAERQTRLDEIFTSGRYNCVSSAVLYMLLARSAGLDVQGVMTRDHAFITLNTGAEVIDVETTNPYGFDPGNRKEFHDGFGRATGFAYVPARNYRDRVSINPLELVSLILSNRIADLEARNRFGDAVPLAINRAALLSGLSQNAPQPAGPASDSLFADPRQDLTDRLFNYGASLVKAGKEADALRWAEYAGERFPDPARWQEFSYAALNNQLVKLIRARRTTEARNELARHRALLDPAQAALLDLMVLEADLADRINGIKTAEDTAAALGALESSAGKLPRDRLEEMRTLAYLKEAERLGAGKDWKGAIAWINGAIARYGRNARFDNALRVFRSNRIAALHNEFAALYNRQNYEAAHRAAREALEEFPGDRQLTADLTMAERALRQ